MAELGDFILGSSNDPEISSIHVDVAMIDYDYVSKCSALPTLKAILSVLKSGKEGRYPHLEKTVEDKVLALMPEKERQKVVAMRQKASPAEVEEEKQDLSSWLSEMESKSATPFSTPRSLPNSTPTPTPPPPVPAPVKEDDGEIFFKKQQQPTQTPASTPITSSALNKPSYPPVRGTKASTSQTTTPISTTPAIPETADQKEKKRLNKESMSNRDYFRAWDKFDVDAEVDALDAAEKASQLKLNEMRKDQYAREVKNRERREKEMELLRGKLNFDSMSTKEREWSGVREKNKGNECFKSNENEEALLFYSRSIALDPTSAVVFANRAMAHIKLNNFEQAVDDCTVALELDPAYTKALSRRGMTHHRCGRYALAEDDFKACCLREEGNKEFKALLERTKVKKREVEGDMVHGKTKRKVMIQEVEDSDEEEILEMGADGFDLSAVEDVTVKKEKKQVEKKEKAVVKESVLPAAVKAPSQTFKKVMIVEESDSDSDSDSEPETETEGPSSDDLKTLGNNSMTSGDLTAAITFYTASIALNPNNIASYNNRALTFLRLNDSENAWTDANKCVELEGESLNLKAVFRRGLASVMKGEVSDLEAAKKDFQTVLSHEGDNEQARKELEGAEGKLKLMLNDDNYSGDEQDRDSVSERSEDSPNGGFVNFSKEELEEARNAVKSPDNDEKAGEGRVARKIVITDDSEDDEEVHVMLPIPSISVSASKKIAITEESDSESDDDDDGETIAINSPPPPPAASASGLSSDDYKKAGNDSLTTGNFEEALKKYDQSLRLNPSNYASLNNKSLALLKLKRWKDAETTARGVIGVEGGNVKAKFRMACAIAEDDKRFTIERLKEAVRMFDESGGAGEKCKERMACVASIKKMEGAAAALFTASASPPAVVKAPVKTSSSSSSVTAIHKRVEAAMTKLETTPKLSTSSSQKKKLPSIPKTTATMESAVRSMKGDAEVISQYLASFKGETYKKCFKDSMDPSLLSTILISVDKTWDGNKERGLKIMNAIAKVSGGLNVVFMVMDDEAREAVKRTIVKVEGNAVICALYKQSFKGLGL